MVQANKPGLTFTPICGSGAASLTLIQFVANRFALFRTFAVVTGKSGSTVKIFRFTGIITSIAFCIFGIFLFPQRFTGAHWGLSTDTYQFNTFTLTRITIGIEAESTGFIDIAVVPTKSIIAVLAYFYTSIIALTSMPGILKRDTMQALLILGPYISHRKHTNTFGGVGVIIRQTPSHPSITRRVTLVIGRDILGGVALVPAIFLLHHS